jgi:hypothetical protein
MSTVVLQTEEIGLRNETTTLNIELKCLTLPYEHKTTSASEKEYISVTEMVIECFG